MTWLCCNIPVLTQLAAQFFSNATFCFKHADSLSALASRHLKYSSRLSQHALLAPLSGASDILRRVCSAKGSSEARRNPTTARLQQVLGGKRQDSYFKQRHEAASSPLAQWWSPESVCYMLSMSRPPAYADFSKPCTSLDAYVA